MANMKEEYENKQSLLAINLSPLEEDPVQKQFFLETTCYLEDKNKEKKWKKERRDQLQKLYEKMRKI